MKIKYLVLVLSLVMSISLVGDAYATWDQLHGKYFEPEITYTDSNPSVATITCKVIKTLPTDHKATLIIYAKDPAISSHYTQMTTSLKYTILTDYNNPKIFGNCNLEPYDNSYYDHKQLFTFDNKDTDGDGVYDIRDECPQSSEKYNGYKDDDGCPDDLERYYITLRDSYLTLFVNKTEVTPGGTISIECKEHLPTEEVFTEMDITIRIDDVMKINNTPTNKYTYRIPANTSVGAQIEIECKMSFTSQYNQEKQVLWKFVSVTVINNTKPLIDTIPNVTINEDTVPPKVNLTGISDGDDGTQHLTVTATSSNPTSIPHPRVNYPSPSTTGELFYSVTHNANGTTDITVTVSDGVDTVTETFTITVTPVNDTPVANDDADTVAKGGTVTTNVLANDSDVDGDSLTIDSVTKGTNGKVSIVGGQVVYVHNGSESTSDSYTYTITDGTLFVTATVTITVTPNNLPIANNDSGIVKEGGIVIFNLAANDIDIDDDLNLTSIVIISEPTNGSVVILREGKVAYNHYGSETTSDSFTYSINDNGGATSNVATVSVTVTPVNDLPVAGDDVDTVAEGGETTTDLVSNDSDADDGLDLASILIISGPTNGALVYDRNGNIQYTHDGSETLSDTYTYTIDDNTPETSNVATVDITVTPVNDPPIVNSIFVTTTENTRKTITLTGSDVDGDSLSFTTTTPTSGSLDGTAPNLTYTPNSNYSGSDSFDFTVDDGNGGTATATVLITVASVNNSPTAVDDYVTTDEDTPVDISVLANDSDVDSAISIDSFTQPSNGLVTKSSDILTYKPVTGFFGNDEFTYTATDSDSTNTATVYVLVNQVSKDTSTTPNPPTDNKVPIVIDNNNTNVKKKGNGGCSDCTPPTLGLDKTYKRVVDDGFSYNGQTVQVEKWYTDFPLINATVGVPNLVEIKVYENHGITNMKWVQFCLGAEERGQPLDSCEVLIEVHLQTYGTTTDIAVKEIVINDKNNLIENDTVTANTYVTQCMDENPTQECVKVDLEYTYREETFNHMLIVNVADKARNSQNFHFNEGVNVLGESVNEPPTITLSNKHASQQKDNLWITYTRVDKIDDTWIDKHGIEYHRINDVTFDRITPVDSYECKDPTLDKVKVWKRTNCHFRDLTSLWSYN